jgi:hypothetical protein
MQRALLHLSETQNAPVVFTDPGTRGRIKRKDIPQDRWQRETLFLRLKPANKVCKLMLFITSAAIN